MELKLCYLLLVVFHLELLIVPYGIETNLEHLLKHFQANF